MEECRWYCKWPSFLDTKFMSWSGILSPNQDPVLPPFTFVQMSVYQALKKFVWDEFLLGQGLPEHYANRMDEHLIHLFFAVVNTLDFKPTFLVLILLVLDFLDFWCSKSAKGKETKPYIRYRPFWKLPQERGNIWRVRRRLGAIPRLLGKRRPVCFKTCS